VNVTCRGDSYSSFVSEGVMVNVTCRGDSYLMVNVTCRGDSYLMVNVTCREDSYSSFVSEGVMVNTAGVLLITMAVTVVFIVTNPNYKRQPLPEEESIPLTN